MIGSKHEPSSLKRVEIPFNRSYCPVGYGEKVKESRRAAALDALRGLAVIAMMLSGVVPWTGLPAWMYHGQEPPPSHNFDPHHSGITWVDLVFPLFLFCLGAAIPLAQAGKPSDLPGWQNSLITFGRGLLLVAFAILNQHFRPFVMATEPGTRAWLIAILGFFLMLGIYGRFPSHWPKSVTYIARAIGWGVAIAILTQLRYPSPNMPGFAKERSDIIILVLATVSVLATYLWRATKHMLEVRAGLLAGLVAFRLSATISGSWANSVWTWHGLDWMFQPEFAGYLLIVIPGTIVGDLLGRWEKFEPKPELVVTGFLTIVVALVVFYLRLNAMLVVAVASIPILIGFRRGWPSPILRWSFVWLALGCLLEPYEGGIKKDPYTMSYLFATAGLAGYGLVAMAHLPERATNLLASLGHNPLLAYEAVSNLVPGIWALVFAPFIGDWATGTAAGLGIAVAKTAILVAIVSAFTRARITMRV
jgi:Domain of unknown function (DUF5009)